MINSPTAAILDRYRQFERNIKMTLSAKEHVEYNGENRARLILKGQWLYDNIAPMPIQIFAINYDYYYEMDKVDGFLEQGDKPELNQKGEQYLLAWHGDKYFSWQVLLRLVA